jgi:cell wall-associated NlpC family hydrolase
MLMSARALPKVLGAFLVAATITGTIPQSALGAPARATVNETAEVKGPKKNKRKKMAMDWAGLPVRVHSAWNRTLHTRRKTPAQIAVETARAQIGKPYRWGATGPAGFDCSGLTSFAWRAAGVQLPHSSRGQYASLPRVSMDDLKPGDVIYRPGHVGIYLGKGRMIHAPQSGSPVQISPLGRVVGAVRPG